MGILRVLTPFRNAPLLCLLCRYYHVCRARMYGNSVRGRRRGCEVGGFSIQPRLEVERDADALV